MQGLAGVISLPGPELAGTESCRVRGLAGKGLAGAESCRARGLPGPGFAGKSLAGPPRPT